MEALCEAMKNRYIHIRNKHEYKHAKNIYILQSTYIYINIYIYISLKFHFLILFET